MEAFVSGEAAFAAEGVFVAREAVVVVDVVEAWLAYQRPVS